MSIIKLFNRWVKLISPCEQRKAAAANDAAYLAFQCQPVLDKLARLRQITESIGEGECKIFDSELFIVLALLERRDESISAGLSDKAFKAFTKGETLELAVVHDLLNYTLMADVRLQGLPEVVVNLMETHRCELKFKANGSSPRYVYVNGYKVLFDVRKHLGIRLGPVK